MASSQTEPETDKDTTKAVASVVSESPLLKRVLQPPTPEQEKALREYAERQRAQEERDEKMRRNSMFGSFLGVNRPGQTPYDKCTLASFKTATEQQKEVVAALTEYESDIETHLGAGRGVLLYGPSGTGKDHLAIAVCRRAILELGKTAKRINGSEWFGTVRDQMDNAQATERELIDGYAHPDILLISDPLPPFGALTQFQATMLYRLVEKRYYFGKATILTINVKNGQEAEDRMGVATWDRLKHGVWVVACNWPSFRRPSREIGVR